MTPRVSIALLLLLSAATLTPAFAQQPPTAPAPAQAPRAPQTPPPATTPAPTTPPAEPGDVPFERIIYGRPVLRIGQDYLLRNGEGVREAVVILGDATIEGRVSDNVVVVLGNARVTDTAAIDQSLVVIGGTVTASANAQVDEDLVIVGGALEAPGDFSPRGQYIVIGPDIVGGQLQAMVPWLTRGLMLGRLIVPGIGWIWGIVLLFFLAYAALNLVFDRAIYACTQTLVDRPLTAFAVGVLVLLLFAPVVTILAVTVVGIPVIPILACGMIVAGLLGRVAVTRWIGMNAVHEEDRESKLQSLRSLAIGFAVICVAYMIPILGIITFATLGVLGLGAGSLAFISAYRRENPPAPRRTPPPVPPVPGGPGPELHTTTGPQPVYAEDTQPPLTAPAQVTAVDEVAAVPPPPPPMPPPASTPAPPGGVSFVPPAPNDLLSFPRATFFDRLAAFVLDFIVVLFVFNVLDLGRGFNERFFFTLLLAYHIGFWAWKGTTLGGIILNLRIVRMDGFAMRFVDALVRGLSSIFSAIVVGLGFLWILKDPERQAWHDRIAGTYVVKVPRSYPL